jgi:hypothetical protein
MAKEHFPYMAIVGVVAVVAVVVLLLSLRTTVENPVTKMAGEAIKIKSIGTVSGRSVAGCTIIPASGCQDTGKSLTITTKKGSQTLFKNECSLGGKVVANSCSGKSLQKCERACATGELCKAGGCVVQPPPAPDFKAVDVEWQELELPFEVKQLWIAVQNIGETVGAPQYVINKKYPIIDNTGHIWIESPSGITQLGDQGGAAGQRLWYSPDPITDVRFNSNPYATYSKGTLVSSGPSPEDNYAIETAVALYKVDPTNVYAEVNENNNCGLYHAEDNTFEALETCPEEWGGVKLSDYE